MFEFNLMHIRTVFTVERGTVRLISIRWGQLYSTHLQTLYTGDINHGQVWDIRKNEKYWYALKYIQN